MRKNLAFFPEADRPVGKITWFEANEFCKKSGKRLPTEWKYASRAGTDTRYYLGNSMNERFTWFKGKSNKETHRIGLKSPNAFELFDMVGNVLRGGSWRNTGFSLRSSYQQSASLPLSLRRFPLRGAHSSAAVNLFIDIYSRGLIPTNSFDLFLR